MAKWTHKPGSKCGESFYREAKKDPEKMEFILRNKVVPHRLIETRMEEDLNKFGRKKIIVARKFTINDHLNQGRRYTVKFETDGISRKYIRNKDLQSFFKKIKAGKAARKIILAAIQDKKNLELLPVIKSTVKTLDKYLDTPEKRLFIINKVLERKFILYYQYKKTIDNFMRIFGWEKTRRYIEQIRYFGEHNVLLDTVKFIAELRCEIRTDLKKLYDIHDWAYKTLQRQNQKVREISYDPQTLNKILDWNEKLGRGLKIFLAENTGDLNDWSEIMQNCIAGYANDAVRGRYIFAAIEEYGVVKYNIMFSPTFGV